MSEESKQWAPKELAYAALDRIVEHPELWDQNAWARVTECGTAHCFAGHVVSVYDPGSRPAPYYDAMVTMSNGDKRVYPEEAAMLLEIDEHEEGDLFAGCLKLGELTANVERIFGPRGSVVASAEAVTEVVR